MDAEFEFHSEPANKAVRTHDLLKIKFKNRVFNVRAYELGSTREDAPVLFVTGGVHGLEKIGAALCLDFLRFVSRRMLWDFAFQHLMESVRLILIPLVNPVGYHLETRANGRGVDLMRNAPLNATESVPFLLGGHRYSSSLPWYRGEVGVVEDENIALFEFFKKQCLKSSCVISIDFHSGFGLKDRLWFPYSGHRMPFTQLAELHSFLNLLEQTHPYHVYHIEPQARSYLLHGDIWDYLHQEFSKVNNNVYLPLTLEMGSWIWVKKNPLQVLSKLGFFNPIKKHRVHRTLRRHRLLFEFLLNALYSHQHWSKLDSSTQVLQLQSAREKWYPHQKFTVKSI